LNQAGLQGSNDDGPTTAERIRDDVINKMCGSLDHPSCPAGRAEAAVLAGEGLITR